MRRGLWALALAGTLPVPLLGCATLLPQPTQVSEQILLLPVSADEAWRLTHAVLDQTQTPIRSEHQASGVLQTDWTEGWGDRRFGLLGGSWRRRHRLTVRLQPNEEQTRVTVRSQVEERAPGGRLALRWQRVASDGSVEADFFKRLKAQAALRGA